jgi:hypothetical protein
MAILYEGPFCANTSWTMYDNGGYFCCDAGKLGYKNLNSNSNGCADTGYQVKDGDAWLSAIGQETKRERRNPMLP